MERFKDYISKDIFDLFSKLPQFFQKHLDKELDEFPKNISSTAWNDLFPEAMIQENDKTISSLRQQRTIFIEKMNDNPLTDLGQELLLTSNVIAGLPLDLEDITNKDLKKKLTFIAHHCKQQYWYDHPIPIGVAPENNELIYGLSHLDKALDIEIKHGILKKNQKINCVLSLSTTHKEITSIAKSFLEKEIKNNLKLKNISLYIFSEDDTNALIHKVLKPLSHKYNLNENIFEFFGVNGKYGRHYSFLKSIAALFQITINPNLKATFKIDLDQVFDQERLIRETGRTAFSHFLSPQWGATGRDSFNRKVKLGMIAGSLVNQDEASKSIFTPDVKMPKQRRYFFCSQIPQAISTYAEMMPDTNEDFSDTKTTVRTRIHVTGGTNGILIEDLKKYRPFTPSFIERAEDQAYILSVFDGSAFPLTYLHKPGLVMRHDKEGFATDAIKKAKVGKDIGDSLRILIFSAYAKFLDPNLDHLKQLLFPFTGCFITKYPLLLSLLRLFERAQAFKDNETRCEFLKLGLERIEYTLNFIQHEMQLTLEKEKNEYDVFYTLLSHWENEPHVNSHRKVACEVIERCKLS
ncbi:MAG: hypothetical protein ACOCUV_00310 [bacterium]